MTNGHLTEQLWGKDRDYLRDHTGVPSLLHAHSWASHQQQNTHRVPNRPLGDAVDWVCHLGLFFMQHLSDEPCVVTPKHSHHFSFLFPGSTFEFSPPNFAACLSDSVCLTLLHREGQK